VKTIEGTESKQETTKKDNVDDGANR